MPIWYRFFIYNVFLETYFLCYYLLVFFKISKGEI